MKISKEFLKIINLVFVISLITWIIRIFLHASGYYPDIYYREDVPGIIISRIFYLVPILLFWIPIGFLTKDFKSTYYVIAFYILVSVVNVFVFSKNYINISSHFSDDKWRVLYDGYFLVSNILGYLMFGFLHFKNPKGVFILLAYFAFYGISNGLNANFLDDTSGDFSIWEEIFIYNKINIGVGLISIQNILNFVFRSFSVVLQITVFYFIYQKLSKKENPDFGFRKIFLSDEINNFSYFGIYWAIRIALFGIIFWLPSALFELEHFGNNGYFIISVVFVLFGIYVFGSIYRNFLTNFLMTKGRHPAWLYLFLNLPIIHIIAWIISLFVNDKRKKLEANGFKGKLEDQLKEKFNYNLNNVIIKIIFILILFIPIFQYTGVIVDSGVDYNKDELTFLLIASIVAIGLSVLYMWVKNAVYFLLILGVSLFSYSLIDNNELVIKVIGLNTLINLIIYYPLFHFDQFKFA
jgi:hypothetical protein